MGYIIGWHGIAFGGMDSAIECTLNEFVNNTKLCDAVNTLETRDAIQRDLNKLCLCVYRRVCGASSWSQTTGWTTYVSLVSATVETGVNETKEQLLEWDQESEVLLAIAPMTGVSVGV